MDAFSDGQIASKLWLCETIEECFKDLTGFAHVWVYGSWYGMLPFLILSRGRLKIENLHLFDIDSNALSISMKVLNHWQCLGEVALHFHKFDCSSWPKWLTAPDLLINTSSEHFADYKWWHSAPDRTAFAIQSTNMKHDEHINSVSSVDELVEQLKLRRPAAFIGKKVFCYPEFEFERYLVVGSHLPGQKPGQD